MAEKDIKDYTGLTQVPAGERKYAEEDLLSSLLAAAAFKNSEEAVTEAEIKRGGRLYFTVHLHPLSDEEIKTARKKSTTYGRNPLGGKYPPIEKERDQRKFNSWLIYLATTAEDRKKIWGSPALLKELDLVEPVDAVDALLLAGEKDRLVDVVTNISGFLDDGEELDSNAPGSLEEYAKN